MGQIAPTYPHRHLTNLAANGQYDPLLFAEYAWEWEIPGTPLEKEDLRTWQAEVFDTIAKHLQDERTRYDVCRIAVSSGHGIGKSAGMGMLTAWALSCFQDARVMLLANTEGQLRTKTSPEVGQWVRSSAFGSFFEIDTLSIKHRDRPEQWRADFSPWSENNTVALQGLHAKDRIVVVLMDEASEIPNKIWEVIIGAMTDENTILVWVAFGNPTSAVGMFRECFRMNRSRWKSWNIDSRKVEGTNKKVLQDIVDTYGEDDDVTRVRVKGQFPRTSARQMVPEYLIDEAMERHYRPDQYNFAPVILSCDPAWTGDDNLVIAMRQGLVFKVLDVLAKNDNDMEIGAKLAEYEVRHNADAVFIDQGWGSGIWSYGVTLGRDWELIPFGGKPADVMYLNKRAEMYGEGVKWLKSGGALPPDQTLRTDLAGIETKPMHDGKISLVSKEDMRKLGLPSPDRADAWALTFARPVHKKPIPMSQIVAQRTAGGRPGMNGGTTGQSVYDPFRD